MHGDARQEFAAFIPEGDVAAFAKNLYASLQNDFTGTMSLLPNKDFLRLLQEYKRKPRVFLVAHGTEDQVSSEWLVRGFTILLTINRLSRVFQMLSVAHRGKDARVLTQVTKSSTVL